MFTKPNSIKDVAIHIGIMLSIFVVIIVLFFYVYLPNTTHHGETIEVPKLIGLDKTQMEAVLEAKNLRYQINDSSYAPDKKANTILDQTPIAGAKVKENRKIYITLSTTTPPKIKMPKLIDGSLKSAEITLKGYGLELGDVKSVTSPYLNLVINQLYKGSPIAQGAYIPKGSKVDLQIGDGTGGEEISVPDLVGMPLEDAKNLLLEKGLNIGLEKVDTESKEAQEGIVTKQSPAKLTAVRTGGMVDIWISE